MTSSAEFTGWHKSSFSPHNSECVEIGHAPGVRGIRDSKLGADSPVIGVSTRGFAALLAAAHEGALDR
ncbi:protein of unknown function [Haloechinothrix alba]|uniref:DUF397 domain-containing protein n=1 Tax=Haloechinothrix alba TaxID=664784 RepID=A0A239AVF3_9PSEU|nr:DUF397 domain-containing protein [Haloechinothrix alba]SNR98948.1 protein of unknown function [Haloechinothrix alba]